MANHGRVFTGRVVSSGMPKTVVVTVDRVRKHPIYGKRIRRKVRLYAHDPENLCNDGDLVRIIESRPYSKLKKFRLLDFVERRPDDLAIHETLNTQIVNADFSTSDVNKDVSINAPIASSVDQISLHPEVEEIVEDEISEIVEETVDSVNDEPVGNNEVDEPQNNEESNEQSGRSDQ